MSSINVVLTVCNEPGAYVQDATISIDAQRQLVISIPLDSPLGELRLEKLIVGIDAKAAISLLVKELESWEMP